MLYGLLKIFLSNTVISSSINLICIVSLIYFFGILFKDLNKSLINPIGLFLNEELFSIIISSYIILLIPKFKNKFITKVKLSTEKIFE
jgi:hypothetical protein